MPITLIDPDPHILDIHRDLSVASRRRKPGPPERISGMSVGIVSVAPLPLREREEARQRLRERGTE